ncbi:MAG: aminotransferase class I/II-fold pyridoxal phosphate-dependent enzyme, partial [Ectobacillus sp.]
MNEVWRRQLQSELETLENHQQMRTLHVVGQGHDSWLIKQGRKLLNLASNNYLGLAGDERLVEAAIAAARRYGAGAAASRLITGNYALYQETEELLAAWKKTEKALLIGSGYTANLGVIAALAGRN